jgi:tetratricopeptide (TPR) repeat protein
MMRLSAKYAELYKLSYNLFLAIFLVMSPAKTLASDSDWQQLVAKGDAAISQQSLSQAEDYYRQALKTVRENSHSNQDLVECQNKLANALSLQDKIEESEALYRRSLRQLERQYGSESPEVVPTLFSLGSIYESEGDVSSAMALYERAFKINEAHYGPYSPEFAKSLHRLGRASYRAGQPEKAEQRYKQALSILEQQAGLGASKQLEELLSDYSDLLRKKDTIDKDLISDYQNEVLKDTVNTQKPVAGVPTSDFQQQMSLRSSTGTQEQFNEDQRVRLRGEIFPFSNASLAPVYNTMSNAFNQQSRFQQGEPLYKRMIAIDVKALGPDHPSVADDLSNLALLYISQQKYADAEPLLRRALAIYEKAYGKDNMIAIRTRASLASIYNRLGSPEEARSFYSNALIQAKTTIGPNNLETAQMLNELAFLYYRQGRLEDACTFYKWALASTEGAAGSQSPLVAACLRDYAQVLRSLGRGTEASEMEERAQNILATADEPSIDQHRMR